MKEWVCKHCGLYQKVKPEGIKAGQIVYFYKNKTHTDRIADKISTGIAKGVVLRRNDDIITILGNNGISKVKAKYVRPENAPASFIYNMFGACKC